jgi:hypothetical protein
MAGRGGPPNTLDWKLRDGPETHCKQKTKIYLFLRFLSLFVPYRTNNKLIFRLIYSFFIVTREVVGKMRKKVQPHPFHLILEKRSTFGALRSMTPMVDQTICCTGSLFFFLKKKIELKHRSMPSAEGTVRKKPIFFFPPVALWRWVV